MNICSKKTLSITILAILISLLFLHFLGDYQLAVEGLELHVETSLAYRGITQIEIPPLGLVRAHTHRPPLKLAIRLNNINLEQIQQTLTNNLIRDEFAQKLEQNIRLEARRYVAGLIVMAGIAGLFAALLLHSTKLTDYIHGMLVSIAVVGLLLTATYKDFNANQFSNPEYEGVLKAAPWMIGIAEEAIAKIDTLSDRLQLVAENINVLYKQIDNLQPIQATEGNIKVLHVSDIHNNPAAIQFIRRMAELFDVNFIIDTGDISDFGTPLEGLLLERIRDLQVPYVFVAGNHDSPDIIYKLKELKGNIIVAENLVEISGLRIAGFHDPSSQTNQITSAPPKEEAKYVEQIKEELKKLDPVDFIAVHSPYVAQPLAGLAPVLVFGHNHQFEVSTLKGSVMVNAGTTGASGLGTLQEIERRPYSVMLLHFYKDETETRLLAVDSIQIDSLTSEFSMQRHLFNDSNDKEGFTQTSLGGNQ